MSEKTVVTTTCDACGKEITSRNEKYGSNPRDPWLSLRMGGHYMTQYGDAVETNCDACGPECAVKILEKTIAKLKELPKSFFQRG